MKLSMSGQFLGRNCEQQHVHYIHKEAGSQSDFSWPVRFLNYCNLHVNALLCPLKYEYIIVILKAVHT